MTDYGGVGSGGGNGGSGSGSGGGSGGGGGGGKKSWLHEVHQPYRELLVGGGPVRYGVDRHQCFVKKEIPKKKI